MNRQCWGERRLDDQTRPATEVADCEERRNARQARIHWTFSLAVGRQKRRRLSPSNEV
jgi:hypothetical protein